MDKLKTVLKKSYILLILIMFYIPLLFMIIFSFNATSDKGYINFGSWNGISLEGYETLFSKEFLIPLANSLLVGVCVSLIVIIFSLSVVYAIWKQKNKYIIMAKKVSTNISIILPDIVIAVGLVMFFGVTFGVLASNQEGFIYVVIGHSVMILPYGILIMYPKSEKFNKSIFEASYDLGYSKPKTWFKTYFVFMFPAISFTFLISMILSFDDFIITMITSNMETVGTDLYQGNFKSWALALGSILVLIVVLSNLIYIIKNSNKIKKVKGIK